MSAAPSAVEREKGRLGRFLAVGGLSVATDLGVFLWLEKSLGWPHPLAKGLSYVAGMLLGFGLNKLWTFGSRRAVKGEALSYALLYAVTLGVNIAAYGMALRQALGLGLMAKGAETAAFLAATGLTTVLNYLGLRFITFRQGIAEREAAEGAS